MTDETQVNDAAGDAMPVDPYHPDTMHEYASIRAPQLQTRVTIEGKDHEIKFKKGVARVSGPVAKEMDRCINEQIGGLYQLVKKLDRAAAIQLATEHAKSIRGAAAKGGFSSAAIDTLKSEMMAGSGITLAEASPNNPEGLAKFADDLAHGDMLITEMGNSNIGDKPAAPSPAPKVFSGIKFRN